MLSSNRIIWSDNGTLIDISTELNEILTGTKVLPIVAAEDALYIGSDLPFNHRYMHVSVANDVVSAMTVALWSGSVWNNAVDIMDGTTSGGATLAQSGVLSWVPERTKPWNRDLSTENITALSTLKIYDLYWARIRFSVSLKATTALTFMGNRFSADTDLFAQYPDLNNSDYMTSFASGKTSWNDQALTAAEYVIQDLKEMNVIRSQSQILDWVIFRNASVHKTAEIIYRSFGKDYLDNVKLAQAAYKASLKLGIYNVDTNANAALDESERKQTSEFLKR